MRTLIRNATCVFPDRVEQINVLIEGRQILDLAPPSTMIVDEDFDATGLHLLPGVIDDQVHFREPGMTHKESLETGSRACLRGGVTTYLEMPNTQPTTTDYEQLRWKLERAQQVSRVNYGFYLGASTENLETLKAASNWTTPGIKIFIGSSTGSLLVDEQEILERIFAETRLPIATHCEDEQTIRSNREKLLRQGFNLSVSDHTRIRDRHAAIRSVARTVDLASRHHHQLHVLHLSTAEEIELIAKSPEFITCEACHPHLFFDETDYDRFGTKIQVNPAVKSTQDREALWNGLRDGRIQVVATDHAPHTPEEKDQDYPQSPSGIPSIELTLPLMLDAQNRGLITLSKIVEVMCANPARIWNLQGKGRIEPGGDADLVLVDLQRQQVVGSQGYLSKADWSPWDGQLLQGWPGEIWILGQRAMSQGVIDDTIRGVSAHFAR